MDKQIIINEVLKQLTVECDQYQEIADKRHAEATDSEIKQEGKYDTRAIEAGYIAGAQARRLEEIKLNIDKTKSMSVTNFSNEDKIQVSAVIEVLIADETGENEITKHYFLTAHVGGYTVQTLGREISVISKASPIGIKLLGREIDDEFKFNSKLFTINNIF